MNRVATRPVTEKSTTATDRPWATNRQEFALRTCIAVGIVMLFAGGMFLFWWARSVFFLLFAGLVFGVFLNGVSEWIQSRTGMSYSMSLGLVAALLLAALGLVGWLMGSEIVTQFSQLAEALPVTFQKLQEQFEQHQWGRWLIEKAEDGSNFTGRHSIITQVTGLVGSLLNFTTGVIVIGFIGLYAAIEPRYYRKGVLHLVPKTHRARGVEILDAMEDSLIRWLKARILSMLIIGVLTSVGLSLLGVPMALALGLLAFALVSIPNLGPVLASVPAILIAWSNGGDTLALQTVGLFLVIETIESYILLPILQRETVYLPPILSVIAVIFFAAIGGILGAFIAAPLLVVLMVLVKQLYVQDVLDDHTVKSGAEAEG